MSAHRSRHGAGILLTASIGCALPVLDANVVGIILPSIARDLGASFADVEWVVSSYVLCFAAMLLPSGSLADRYGRKRMYLLGLGLFALASLACGLADHMMALYIARAIQGVGAALLLAPALAVIGHAFHGDAERTRAWAVWGVVMGVAMVVSPLAGGVVNALLGWRWGFFINVPACALLAAAVVQLIDESRDPTPRRVDVLGIILFAGAMLCLTWALISGADHGWTERAVVGRAALGLVLMGLFYVAERFQQHPMLDMRLFTAWPFIGAIAAMFAYAACAQVMASLLPVYLQNAGGLSPLGAAVGMMPFAIAMLVFPQLGRMLGRWLSSARILVLGLWVVAVGNLILMVGAEQGSALVFSGGMAIVGAGGGLMNGETTKAIMAAVPRDQAGMASGISTTFRFSGILLGFAGLGALMASRARESLVASFDATGTSISSDFIERMVAGDVAGAMAQYRDLPRDAMETAGRFAAMQGFALAFLVAAVLAAATAVIVTRASRVSAVDMAGVEDDDLLAAVAHRQGITDTTTDPKEGARQSI